MALSRYICIYITHDRQIRDVTTIHAGDDSEACEQALAGCLARREAELGYELWRPKRWVAAYFPKGGFASLKMAKAAEAPAVMRQGSL